MSKISARPPSLIVSGLGLAAPIISVSLIGLAAPILSHQVENNGFEPLTPCLQSRCSSQLS